MTLNAIVNRIGLIAALAVLALMSLAYALGRYNQPAPLPALGSPLSESEAQELAGRIAAISHGTATYLSGKSMLPTSGQNTIVIHRQHYAKIAPNDFVIYRSGASLYAHRVVDRDAQGWITKGDNNAREDRGRVTENNYIGTVIVLIPYKGQP
jgi:signal peptidase I